MSENNQKKSGGKGLAVVVIILLFISVGINVWQWKTGLEQQATIDQVALQLEDNSRKKDSLNQELKDLWTEYEYLKTNNDSLQFELQGEQEKIKELIQNIKSLRYTDRQKLEEYKNQIGTLRNVMKNYVVQLDSLNTMNKTLTEENRKIRTDYHRSQNQNIELENKLDTLKTKVAEASTLKALNIKVNGLNARDNETKKAAKVSKIETCFELSENVIAERGNKTIYIRIMKPNGTVLINSENDIFSYHGDDLLFSTKRVVQYTGAKQNICIYWTGSEILSEGDYQVDLFTDKTQIGTRSLMLK